MLVDLMIERSKRGIHEIEIKLLEKRMLAQRAKSCQALLRLVVQDPSNESELSTYIHYNMYNKVEKIQEDQAGKSSGFYDCMSQQVRVDFKW